MKQPMKHEGPAPSGASDETHPQPWQFWPAQRRDERTNPRAATPPEREAVRSINKLLGSRDLEGYTVEQLVDSLRILHICEPIQWASGWFIRAKDLLDVESVLDALEPAYAAGEKAALQALSEDNPDSEDGEESQRIHHPGQEDLDGAAEIGETDDDSDEADDSDDDDRGYGTRSRKGGKRRAR